jgi:hypothetical protein
MVRMGECVARQMMILVTARHTIGRIAAGSCAPCCKCYSGTGALRCVSGHLQYGPRLMAAELQAIATCTCSNLDQECSVTDSGIGNGQACYQARVLLRSAAHTAAHMGLCSLWKEAAITYTNRRAVKHLRTLARRCKAHSTASFSTLAGTHLHLAFSAI